jgi:hypothetical protein
MSVVVIWGCSNDEGESPTVPDTFGPRVTVTSPADGDSNVALDALVNVTFSEEIDPLTVTNFSFRIDNGVSGNITRGSKSASFEPDTSLSYGVTYTATLTSAITDISGNHMDANYDWSFTTLFGELMPLAVGNRWRFQIINFENPVVPDTTYDTIQIVDDTLIQSQQWFMDTDGLLLCNRIDGLWRIKPGGQPHLFLRFPGITGQIYPADPAIGESITIQGTNVYVSTEFNIHPDCYHYISISNDPTVRWDYFYDPRLGPAQFIRYEVIGQTNTLKERWSLIRFSPALL